MKKILLNLFVSLLTRCAIAQDLPVSVISIIDSNNIVTDFTYALKENSKIILTWRVARIDSLDFFSIERSSTGKDFEVIEVFKSLSKNKFELVDESPLKGKSFYRIRSSVNGRQVVSRILPVWIGGDRSFKFYPNPADNILIVRSDLPYDIQIQDASGEVRISQSRVQGLQTINVSSLEKGVYMLRFTNKVSNVVVTEKLIKN